MACTAKQHDEKLVIIGAGPTGASLAKISQKLFNVTLIDPREAMVIKPAGVRAVCSEEYMQASLVPLENICPKGKFIRGEAKSIDTATNSVLLADGQKVPFDYLAVATGGISMSPCEASGSSISDMIHSWTDTMNKIKACKECVIVGGGPVGVELAGEIAHWQQSAKVTIVHSGEHLCNNSTPLTLPMKKIEKITKQLKERGVDILTGDRVEGDEEGPITMERLGTHKNLTGQRTLTLKSGKKISCDLLLWCTGFKPNGDVVASSLGMEGKVDEKGQVKVNKYLQVEGMTNVFSLGDCNNVPETKMMMTSMSNKGAEFLKTKGQADIVLANMDALRRGKPLTEYIGNKHMSLKMMLQVGDTGIVWGLLPDAAIGAKGGDCMTVALHGEFGSKIKKPPTIPKRTLIKV
mmetsp:Transcript_10490/g.20664  ORF Transcript_10490/g.20664 Transcript_10490/m.20664 type:complete len:407 (+) Transcript_10490:61-1281(+)